MKESVQIIAAALQASSDEDLVIDVQRMLKTLPNHLRLILIAVAAGVPPSLLREFHNSGTYRLLEQADERFMFQVKRYRKQLKENK